MNDLWDTAGYIASSRYRVSVCKYLDREGARIVTFADEHGYTGRSEVVREAAGTFSASSRTSDSKTGN